VKFAGYAAPRGPQTTIEPLSDLEAPPIRTNRLELVWLDRTALAALLRGDRALVGRQTSATIPDEWIAHCRGLLALRLDQMERDPAQGPWLIRAIVLKQNGTAIGQIGFHGGPGVNGLRADDAVELGYSILPAFRGSGFATEAARGLMHWASSERGVRRFLVSVGPSNLASVRVIAKLGFVEVARVWDEDDGEEIVYERRLP
jgi:[ribosomal protein S5]-alanine N-acetyltransferase